MTDELSPKANQILAGMGALLIAGQTAEHLIAICLELVLQTAPVTLESLTSEREKNAKATLGRLILKLKERVDLDDDFEDVLNAFLIDRNSLVHDIGRIEGFDLKTDAGLQIAETFVFNLWQNCEAVTKAFMALLVDWSDQTGFGSDGRDQARAMLGEYEGSASSIFFAKP